MTRATTRIEALRGLLSKGKLSTQDELREELAAMSFDVTQSTISRDLRRLGAIRAVDAEGRTVYRMPEDVPVPAAAAGSLRELIIEIQSNGSIIVLHTTPGSASLVARHLDHAKPGGILGTIAGDDTIFVAPGSTGSREINMTIRAIQSSFDQLS